MAEFLQTGGDPEWLLGLHRAPEKLRKLSEINKLLHTGRGSSPRNISRCHGQRGSGSKGTGLGHVRQSA